MFGPLYRQIADDLQQRIESGALTPGQRLPTEPELRERYGASRNTVRDAVRWLTTRGLVRTRPGQGTFVVERAEPYITTLSADPDTGLGGGEGQAFQAEVVAQGRSPRASQPRVSVLQAADVVADQLQVAAGSSVVSRHQERFIDGAPFSLQTSYYPMALVHAGATRLIEATSIHPGTGAYLEDVLGLRQARYSDLITVRTPTVSETLFFELPDSGRVSVFETFRTAFDAEDKPFRLTVSVFAADRNEFAVFSGVVPAQARKVTSPRSAEAGTGRDA
jgi:GntR family transcriptional regulator